MSAWGDAGVTEMKTKIVAGAAFAVAAVGLALSGAVTASAEDKPKTATKPPAEKMACGKNGCGASMNKDGKTEGAAQPASTGDQKPAEAKK